MKNLADYAREERKLLQKEMQDPNDVRTDEEKALNSIQRMTSKIREDYDKLCAKMKELGID